MMRVSGSCWSWLKKRLGLVCVAALLAVLLLYLSTRSTYRESFLVRQLTNKTFAGLEQDDPALVSYVRQLIIPPSTKAYNLTNPTKVHFSQYDQSAFAENTFINGMDGGFFVEMGALDGEDKSNTLYFEKYRGWSGLLIEPDPKLFRTLSGLNRKAYSINAAVSLTNVSALVTFRPARGEGRIWENSKKGITVQCFPLYTMLLALSVRQIDFFSLDIEGHEMKCCSPEETVPGVHGYHINEASLLCLPTFILLPCRTNPRPLWKTAHPSGLTLATGIMQLSLPPGPLEGGTDSLLDNSNKTSLLGGAASVTGAMRQYGAGD